MNKFNLLIILGIFVVSAQLILIAYLTSLFPQSISDHTNQLSERAMAFYQEQKPANPIWRHRIFDFETEEDQFAYLNPTDALPVRAPCAGVTIPFRAKNPNISQPSPSRCVIRASLQDPPGNVTITIDQFPTDSISNNSHVLLRINNPDIYHQRTISITKQFDQYYAFQSDTEVTLFAQTPTQHFTISFSNLSPIDITQISSQKINKLIDSISLNQSFIGQSQITPTPTTP